MGRFDFSQVYEHHETYPKGTVIFEAGDDGDALYLILEGEVKISIDAHTIDMLEAGTIFGEMALVDAKPRSADATAVSHCKLVKIDEPRFAQLASQYPQFGLEVMNIMSTRLRRLIDDEVRRQRLEQELAIGREIQLSLLPKKNPTYAGWQFATIYRPARQVGGDIYDFIQSEQTPNQLTIVVADVTGKGVPAALFMASTRSVIRTLCNQNHAPADVLALANQAILKDGGPALFLSSVIGNLDTKTGELTLANAGHEWPLWLRAAQNDVETLYVPGVLLGAFTKIVPQQKTVTIESGDFLFFFTDGVTEARNAEGDFFGDERLLETAVSGKNDTAAEMAMRVETAVSNFTQNTPQSDDLTLVIIKRL